MKSIVRVEMKVPIQKAAQLFADPRLMPKWMTDLERCEFVSGEPGTEASTFRMIPKKGSMIFFATIIRRAPPYELRILLNHPSVDVSVLGRMRELSPSLTQLESEEEFKFKGILRIFGRFAAGFIRKAHRNHIEAFKHFAEENSPL